MLEEEGIYERCSSSQKSWVPDNTPARERPSGKEAILLQLEASPESAISTLTHLPIDLQSLDLLTTLVQTRALEKLSIETRNVIRNYIQHGLRLIERMGLPPSAVDGNDVDGRAPDEEQTDSSLSYDREAQIRAVKLLLLFIRNLIRKALLPPEAIYFEIQEICVRYVWIKEVRDFRAFIEEGAAG